MTIFDVMAAPWAILPDKLEAIFGIYERHIAGVKLTDEEISARIGNVRAERQPLTVENGVAVIPIIGTIAKRANLFSSFSGGTSTEMVRNDFREALHDPEVQSILLMIDSPGGTVSGTQELAREIFESRGDKPIIAFTDGTMASAAYWIGAAADEVVISGDTTQVGSIGVVAKHVDRSRQNEMMGVKESEIVAGKFKRSASTLGPLTETGYRIIQEAVDHLYQVFVEDVATFRGVSIEDVLANMADGRVFMGKQAIEAGLVDRQENLTTVLHRVAQIQGGVKSMSNKATAQETVSVSVDVEAIKAESFSDGLKQGLEVGKKDGFETGLKQGAEKERARIQGIEALKLKGHDELLASMKYDGTTTPEQAAIKVVQAEQSLQAKNLNSLYEGSVPPVPAEQPKKEEGKNMQAEVDAFIEDCTVKGMAYKEALIEANRKYPDYFRKRA